ncbi:MAG: DegV family protein [Aristaeellaceae bacterium]
MIRIVTDSMSDLKPEEGLAMGVTVLPQPVRFGTEEHWDGLDIARDEFFARLRVATELPKTSCVPPEKFLEAFNQLLENAEDEVLCITGSSKLSGCYQAAVMAREGCDAPERVTLVDSLNATTAEALLVMLAARKREEVASAAELAAYVEELKQHHRVVGHTATLKYLVMGGRLNPVVGKVGAALNIRPMLKIEGGEIGQAALCRGAAKTRSWYVEQLRQFPPDKRYPVIVAGADCPAQVAEFKQLLEESGLDLPPIQTMEIGCIIGTHVGPDLTLVTWIQA